MNKLTKRKLIACLAVKHSITQETAENIVGSMFDLMTDSFKRNEAVMFTGFGTFIPKMKEGGTIVGLGGKHRVHDRLRIKFVMSNKMKESLNSGAGTKKTKLVERFKRAGRDED
jgi:nucleoid DNA-binding protein